MRVATDNRLNQLRVLKSIRHNGPVARVDLPSLTGLSTGLVSKLVTGLIDRGLVQEKREDEATKGRPRTYLSIAENGAIVMGAGITGDGMVTTVFVDLAGRELCSSRVPLIHPQTLDELVVNLADSLGRAITDSPFEHAEVHRIGLALPAIIDTDRGIVHYVSSLEGGPTNFRKLLSDLMKIPVTIENEMMCLARAEHWFGRAQDLDTFAVLDIGYSLGSARYWQGIPVSGANGFGPEIGHVKIDTSSAARRCYCGSKGCATMYTAMYGILSSAGMLEGKHFSDIETLSERLDVFLDRARRGEPKAASAMNAASSMLGLVVANYINLCDPRDILVLLPNDLFRQMIEPAFNEALFANTMPGMYSSTRLRLDISSTDWRRKGTAALALEQLYLGPSAEDDL